jgi:hypothetical protein
MRDLKISLDSLRRWYRNPPSEKSIRKTLPKAARKAAKTDAKRVLAIIRDTCSRGASQLVDRELRWFFREFNNRLVRYGPESMPSSFNVLEAFLLWDADLHFYRLREERDHLFSFSDFVDFVTSSDSPNDPYSAAYQYAEGVIYNFSLYDDPHDLTFSSSPGDEFAVGGLSLIRHGDELSMMLVGGTVADLEEESSHVATLEVSTPFPGREKIRADDDLAPRAEPLGEFGDLWKTLVLVRFDLKRRAQEVRYILHDGGDHFSVTTDDAIALTPSTDSAVLQKLIQNMDRYGVLFELCRTAIELHAYFNFKVTLVREERVEGQRRPTPERRRSPRRKHGYSGRVIYKSVTALRIINPSSRSVRRYSAPRFQVDVDGSWRKVGSGTFGKGPDGMPVEGRTWVREHLRWKDRPEKPIEVLVKSRVAIARAKVEAEKLLKRVAREAPPRTPKSEPKASLQPSARPTVSREEAFRQRTLLTPRVRWAVLQRDDFKCQKCGADAARDPGVRLDVDHIEPVSRGGKTESGNLQTLCSRCNNGKGDQIA